MLYDPKWESETSFFRDLSKPSLENLSYALRHRERWPAGFEWDYLSCHSCAMGLAFKLWQEIDGPSHIMVSEAIGQKPEDMFPIFLRTHRVTRVSMSEVTPEMVADQLDRFAVALERPA